MCMSASMRIFSGFKSLITIKGTQTVITFSLEIIHKSCRDERRLLHIIIYSFKQKKRFVMFWSLDNLKQLYFIFSISSCKDSTCEWFLIHEDVPKLTQLQQNKILYMSGQTSPAAEKWYNRIWFTWSISQKVVLMKPQHPKYKVFQGKKTSSEVTF